MFSTVFFLYMVNPVGDRNRRVSVRWESLQDQIAGLVGAERFEMLARKYVMDFLRKLETRSLDPIKRIGWRLCQATKRSAEAESLKYTAAFLSPSGAGALKRTTL